MATGTGETPFLRLLIPVITGIIICSFFTSFSSLSKHIAGASGLLLILISFFVKKEYKFKFRWLFGAGVFLFILSLTQVQYHLKEQYAEFDFPESEQYYVGTITDIPEVKPRTIACNVKINAPVKKKAVLYIQQTDDAWSLEPGDEILFYAKIQPFKNLDIDSDFDYPRYMNIKGFSGSAYIPKDAWSKTGKKTASITAASQRFRLKALKFYKSFELDPDAYAFVSALTLGYKKDLTDSVQEAFRVSGTAHVLAVSGLHVGIIYIAINLLLSFLGKQGRSFIVRQWLVIIVLWAYAFVTGMSASIIRAVIMLSINCVAKMFSRKSFTYNTLAAAAFFILIYNPVSFFDISFQMSFTAVVAILFFYPKIKSIPKLNEFYSSSGKASRYIYDLFTVSLSAQLGVFPIVLYYFGTFPTYFFITNILVIPLVGFVIYAVVPLIFLNLIPTISAGIIDFLNKIFQWMVKTFVEATLQIVYFAEKLPLAQISNIHITTVQLILLLFFVFISGYSLSTRRPKPLLAALSSLLLLLLTSTYSIIAV